MPPKIVEVPQAQPLVRHPRTRCPICQGNYGALHRSFDVCRKHENWLVTRCSECGRFSFSDASGFCMRHGLGGSLDVDFFGSPDPNQYLKSIGQQGASRGA